ncbi:MAG: hypothetical protein HY000_35750 [Planctomycetes bacterium]|nr:hypothetical protein [Planctomycetota bacterium]
MGHPILFAENWGGFVEFWVGFFGSLFLGLVVLIITPLYFIVILVGLFRKAFRSLRVVIASLVFSAFASAAWYAMYRLTEDPDKVHGSSLMLLLTGSVPVFFWAAPLIQYSVIRALADKKFEPRAPTQTVSNPELDPEERKMLTSFLTRRNELRAKRRTKLAELLARPLYEKYGGHYGDAESYIERLAVAGQRQNPGRPQTDTRGV